MRVQVSGVLKPGRLTLLLGPPGSGKTVFLQALSGRLKTGPRVRVSCLCVCEASSKPLQSAKCKANQVGLAAYLAVSSNKGWSVQKEKSSHIKFLKV